MQQTMLPGMWRVEVAGNPSITSWCAWWGGCAAHVVVSKVPFTQAAATVETTTENACECALVVQPLCHTGCCTHKQTNLNCNNLNAKLFGQA